MRQPQPWFGRTLDLSSIDVDRSRSTPSFPKTTGSENWRVPREGTLMAPRQETPNRLVDMVVCRPVGHQPRAIAENKSPRDFAAIEAAGLENWLDGIETELRTKTYQLQCKRHEVHYARHVGMPSGRSPPPGFGIITRRTGCSG
jgi:hypothetical protein